MSDANRFWKNPKTGPKMQQWSPGEARSYIPVISFRAPETTPAGGLVGKIAEMDGTRQVRFTVKGPKTAGTK